jgi:large subunit ribosomal protein L18
MKRLNTRAKIRKQIVTKTYKNTDKHFIGVYKSNLYTYAYLVNPAGQILKGLTTKGIKGTKTQASATMGEDLGKFIIKSKVAEIYFNRSGYKYQGRIKAICEGVRKAGVKI